VSKPIIIPRKSSPKCSDSPEFGKNGLFGQLRWRKRAECVLEWREKHPNPTVYGSNQWRKVFIRNQLYQFPDRFQTNQTHPTPSQGVGKWLWAGTFIARRYHWSQGWQGAPLASSE